MELKVGGKYRTRDGRSAEVFGRETDEAGNHYEFRGRADGVPYDWSATGRFLSNRESVHDLVEEIVEPHPGYTTYAEIARQCEAEFKMMDAAEWLGHAAVHHDLKGEPLSADVAAIVQIDEIMRGLNDRQHDIVRGWFVAKYPGSPF